MTNQHPSWESLVTWVEAGAEGREIAAHLAGCEPCAADAAWLAQTLDAMQGDAAFKAPPDGVRQRAIAAHRQRYPSTGHGKAQRTLPRRSLLYALLAAAALLLFMVVVQRQPSKAAPLVAVTGVEGEVTVTNRDEQTRRVMNGAPLEIGDRLTTGEDGLAIVEFRGNQAAVKVWSNSELSVDDLVVDEGQITALDITCRDGRMKATVAQPMAFTMQAYGNELTTRQGEFEVEYYRG
ncbi:MAG: hypothetical protein H6637_01000 [Ardenticatenales bacterium]|nr:hypothetical protein [Ardenticatenales bacterium]